MIPTPYETLNWKGEGLSLGRSRSGWLGNYSADPVEV
jgi:hypothetical protein